MNSNAARWFPPPPAVAAPVDERHAAELALWSQLEGLARRGREACERGEQFEELVALRGIRDVSHTLAVKP